MNVSTARSGSTCTCERNPTTLRPTTHESFVLLNVDVDEQAELAERFNISEVPTIVVVEGKRVHGRLESPRGCCDIEQLLAPWLR